MSRLIDADALIMDYISDDAGNNAEIISRNDILDAPIIDAVEIVRCKNCKYRRREGDSMLDWCPRLICGTIRDDFYCADGERIEDAV